MYINFISSHCAAKILIIVKQIHVREIKTNVQMQINGANCVLSNNINKHVTSDISHTILYP